MTEARVVKFCTQVGDVKSQHTHDKSSLKKAWPGSRDPFYIFVPTMISLKQLKLLKSLKRLKLESSNFIHM